MTTESWGWKGLITGAILSVFGIVAAIYIPKYLDATKLDVSFNHIGKPGIDLTYSARDRVIDSIAAVEKEEGIVGLKDFTSDLLSSSSVIVSLRITNNDTKRSKEVEVNPSLREGTIVLISMNGKSASQTKVPNAGPIKLGTLDPNDEVELTYVTSEFRSRLGEKTQVLHDGQRLTTKTNNLEDQQDPLGLLRFHFDNSIWVFTIFSTLVLFAFLVTLGQAEKWYRNRKLAAKAD
jgi:hypothetical protein